MDSDDGQGPFEPELDEELDDALEILKGISQREAAAQIGISERRLRDIEWRRSTPRRKTRDAIIHFAEGVRGGQVIGDSRGASQGDGSVGPLIFGGVLLAAIIIGMVLHAKPPEG
jgi:hypothetical protein